MKIYIRNEDGTFISCTLAEALESGLYGGNINNTVRRDSIGENITVSTVFLHVGHNYSGIGPPLLWETMVFDAEEQFQSTTRYSSEPEAIAGHNSTVLYIREQLGIKKPKKSTISLASEDDIYELEVKDE